MDPKRLPHGTRNGYNSWGCRCEECKKASSEYLKNYRRIRLELEVAAARADSLQQRKMQLDR